MLYFLLRPKPWFAFSKPNTGIVRRVTSKPFNSFSASKCPDYQQLFAMHPVNNVWFCLYPEGMICILPTTPEEAGKLQQKMKQLLNTFPPQKVSQNGIDVYYYADAENEFAGAFYANGLWVSSYNKVLLDQTLQRINLQIHPTQETNIPLAHYLSVYAPTILSAGNIQIPGSVQISIVLIRR